MSKETKHWDEKRNQTLGMDVKLEKKPVKETVLNHYKQKNPRLDFLDLAYPKEKFKSLKYQVLHLIASLQANYNSFVFYKKSHDPNFFGVARVALPPMKYNSPFQCIEPFIQEAKQFLNGSLQDEAVEALLKLEEEVDLRYAKSEKGSMSEDALREKILLEILIQFEQTSGFSDAVVIGKDAGPKKDGLITPKQFNELVFAAKPFIDYGATTQHGPHSHRVQWYILAQFFNKKASVFFKDTTIEQIRGLIIQFKILPSKNVSDLTKEYIQTHFISILYRMFGIPEFNKSFEWEQFKKELQERYKVINPGRLVPKEMSPPHIWPQLFDNRGYDGSFTVPSGFGFLQNRSAFQRLPILGRPNIAGINASKSLKTILEITKPIEPVTQKRSAEYLDPAISRISLEAKAGVSQKRYASSSTGSSQSYSSLSGSSLSSSFSVSEDKSVINQTSLNNNRNVMFNTQSASTRSQDSAVENEDSEFAYTQSR